MIFYSFPEEKEYILFFSEKTGYKTIPALLESNSPISKDDARTISIFFWEMIDLSVELNNSQECPWPEGYEFWSEKVLQSVAAFLKKSGYESALQEASNYKK